MSLIEQLKAEEDKKNKLFHEISMAASFLKVNIAKSKEAETKKERDSALKYALEDAKHIEEMALSVVEGTYKNK